MFLNKSDPPPLPYRLIHSSAVISEPFRNFLFNHQFLAARNSNLIQTERLNKLDPKITLFLKNLNLFEQSNNQTVSVGAFIQSDLHLPDVETVTSLDSVVKIHKDVPLDVAIIMFGYIMPILLIITIIFNSAIVIVLSQKHMRTPTNMVLLSMAIFDMLTLIFPSPWYFYAYFLGRYHYLPSPKIFCYLFHYMNEVLPAFFHTASIWLTLLLAGQRYIYVCHPIIARDWCTIAKVGRFLILVAFLAFAHQFTRFFDRNFQDVVFQAEDGKTVKACLFSTAAWVSDVVGENLYYTSYYGFRILFVHIIPCTALVILNLLLFQTLKLARQNRKKLFSRCTAPSNISETPANSKTTLKINRSGGENLLHKTTNKEDDILYNKKSKSKQILRFKLSNAFTTIIMNKSLTNQNPELNKQTDDAFSSIQSTGDTLPTSDTVACTTAQSNTNFNPDSTENSATNCSEENPITNQSNEQQEDTQLIAHQIAKTTNKTSSSMNYSCLISNQISTQPDSFYKKGASSLAPNGQYSQKCLNTTIIPNNMIVHTSVDLAINPTSVNNINVNTIIAPSIQLSTSRTTKTADLDSDSANGDINYKIDSNLVNQGHEFNSTLVNRNVVDNESDYKTSNRNQLNLPSNDQLKNLSKEKSDKNKINKPLTNFDNFSSASCTSTNPQKTSSCKKLNTLECKRQRDNQCTTLMLIVVVSVFLFTEIPLAITTFLHVTQNIVEIYIANYKTLNSTILFTNFFIMLSYPVNFAIYCGMSRQFRETFKILILNRILCRSSSKRRTRNLTTTTNATYSNFECSRPQYRRNSATNQLITSYPSSNVVNLKTRKLSSQKPSDYCSTSNNPLTDFQGESTSMNRQIRISSLNLEMIKESGEENTTKRAYQERSKEYDERHIRFKTNSFELENCDLNNNGTMSDALHEDDKNNGHLNQLESNQDNDKKNSSILDRTPYTETNL